MNLSALEAAGVSKRYGNRDVLCGVDLVVSSGRLHGLLGPNGAGKTTLLRVLLGLVRRDAGTVRLLGRPIDPFTAPVPDGVAGFVEMPAFYPYLSARRNLTLLARLDGRASRAASESVDRAIEQVGLLPHADAAVGGYSAGMRQRLGLAAALLRAPRLLLLDEPTNALDPGGARDVRALVQRLAADGTAVVLSSHDMSEVEELCASVTIIDHGRVILSGTIAELRGRTGTDFHAVHTSDDDRAMAVARGCPGVVLSQGGDGGLLVIAGLAALDGFVIALGRAGIAVRRLEPRTRSLESVFLHLTGNRRS